MKTLLGIQREAENLLWELNNTKDKNRQQVLMRAYNEIVEMYNKDCTERGMKIPTFTPRRK